MRRWTAAIRAGAAGLWILVALNEILLTPPMMTPAVRMRPEMAGTFRDTSAIVFRVNTDTSVSGTFGGLQLQGKLQRNRTWFGRWMHWRSDYIVRGSLSDGRPVSAPLTWTGSAYRGAVFVGPGHKRGPTGVILKPS